METMGRLCFLLLFCSLTLLILGSIIAWQSQAKDYRKKREKTDDDVHDGDIDTFLGGGAIYIRWGRLSCPEPDTELVYEGSAAGGHSGHVGTPANILCLPRDPTWGQYNDAWQAKNLRSRLYGVEYRPQANDFPFSHENAEALQNHNVPCAVCKSLIRSTHLMVPGRNDCLKGWNLEYTGYLMSGGLDYAASSEFVCVDKDPEADPAGFRAETSQLLFTVESECGSIPCPKYVNGREVTCSVCTK